MDYRLMHIKSKNKTTSYQTKYNQQALTEHGFMSAPTQYTADGFYRSDDPTSSVKALKEGG